MQFSRSSACRNSASISFPAPRPPSADNIARSDRGLNGLRLTRVQPPEKSLFSHAGNEDGEDRAGVAGQRGSSGVAAPPVRGVVFDPAIRPDDRGLTAPTTTPLDFQPIPRPRRSKSARILSLAQRRTNSSSARGCRISRDAGAVRSFAPRDIASGRSHRRLAHLSAACRY